VRSVILTGDEAGGAFSAGANLRDPNTHNTRSAEAFIKRVGRARNFPPTCRRLPQAGDRGRSTAMPSASAASSPSAAT
jgi:hypothetical protein